MSAVRGVVGVNRIVKISTCVSEAVVRVYILRIDIVYITSFLVQSRQRNRGRVLPGGSTNVSYHRMKERGERKQQILLIVITNTF